MICVSGPTTESKSCNIQRFNKVAPENHSGNERGVERMPLSMRTAKY